jgi:CheY-like chemotaxis protein
LRSTPGKGSTFTLYLPLTDDDLRQPLPSPETASTEQRGGYELEHTPEPAPTAPALMRSSTREQRTVGEVAELKGKKILVVDDDVRNLFSMTSLLERRGAKVLPAGSGREAFELLEEHPDTAVVLMDMMMPEMDGFEATRLLREDERYKELPIVALTAKAMPADREKALTSGCNDFVPKPVEQERLLAVLKQWVKRG